MISREKHNLENYLKLSTPSRAELRIRIRDPVPLRPLDLGSGIGFFRILDPGSQIRIPGSRISYPGSKISDSGSRTSDPGSQTHFGELGDNFLCESQKVVL